MNVDAEIAAYAVLDKFGHETAHLSTVEALYVIDLLIVRLKRIRREINIGTAEEEP